MFLKSTALAASVLFSVTALAQEPQGPSQMEAARTPEDVMQLIQSEFEKLPASEQAKLQSLFEDIVLGPELGAVPSGNLYKMSSSYQEQQARENRIPFLCAGWQAGGGKSWTWLSCINTHKQVFTLKTKGTEFALIAAGNVAAGWSKGAVIPGKYKLDMKISVYLTGGVTYLSGGNVTLWGTGVGGGASFNWDVPAHSLSGGELVIE